MPPQDEGNIEARLLTELRLAGQDDNVSAVVALTLARRLDLGIDSGEDLAALQQQLAASKASALTWGENPPLDDLQKARLRRARRGQ